MILTKDNIKVGMKISLKEIFSRIATIVAIDAPHPGYMTLSWDDPIHPKSPHPIQKYWLINGTYQWSIEQETMSENKTIRNEKPCSVCSRMNDVGEKKCWHCESKLENNSIPKDKSRENRTPSAKEWFDKFA